MGFSEQCPQEAARTQVGFHAGLKHYLEIGWSCTGEAPAKQALYTSSGDLPCRAVRATLQVLSNEAGDG